jgi:hypothetical protein
MMVVVVMMVVHAIAELRFGTTTACFEGAAFVVRI